VGHRGDIISLLLQFGQRALKIDERLSACCNGVTRLVLYCIAPEDNVIGYTSEMVMVSHIYAIGKVYDM